MKPTGVYYEPLAYHLHKIGQTVYVVLPNKARSFCETEGIKTKADAMDARCLTLMGCTSHKLKPWSPPAPIYCELRQMTRFHADLSQIMTSVMNPWSHSIIWRKQTRQSARIVRNSLTRLYLWL